MIQNVMYKAEYVTSPGQAGGLRERASDSMHSTQAGFRALTSVFGVRSLSHTHTHSTRTEYQLPACQAVSETSVQIPIFVYT